MQTTHDEIRSKTEAFAADVTAMVKRAALLAVQAALGTTRAPAPAKALPAKKAAPAAAAPKKAAPAAKKPAKAAPAKAAKAVKAAPAKKAAAKRPLGAKRPPAEIAKLTDKLGDYIRQNPGLGVELIGKALATPTSELTLPIKKLLGAKKIRFEGHKRATRYFPA